MRSPDEAAILFLRWLTPFALVVLLPACSDSGGEAADTTLAPSRGLSGQGRRGEERLAEADYDAA
jgi:hypothetical protein